MGATLSSLCSTSAEMDTVDGNHFRYLTFCCRVHAIDILNEVKIGSASDADNGQWKDIYDKIHKYDREMSDDTLKKLREELKNNRDSANSSIFDIIKRVSDAFDTDLLSYLQAKVHLMEKLGDCLPDQGQSWEEFVMDLLEESTQPNALHKDDLILPDLKPDAGQEVLETLKTRTRILMSAIEGVDVKKSGVSQSAQKENKIKVFYATNRVWSDASYTSNPGNCLLYGFQQVSIPGDHDRGKVESPNKFGRGNDSKHFMLKEKYGPWKESDKLFEQIGRESDSECAPLNIPSQNDRSANDVESSTGGPQKIAREVLLYIHGYNVSYKSAVRLAAQLKNDLEFQGPVILYSWPTMGHLLAYSRDGRVIKGTAQFLHQFITTILGEGSFSKVHILAHSMGNRALIKALRMPKPQRYKEHFKELVHQRGVLKNVILAAADEKLRKFKGLLEDWPDSVHGPQISVYSSARDRPLIVSGFINWDLRLGNTESLFNEPLKQQWQDMVDVIDASGVRCNSWQRHSYYAEAPEVLDDIQKLLKVHHRAAVRLPTRFRHTSGQVFHVFVRLWWECRFKKYIHEIEISNQALPTRVTDGYE